jgi:hypothetical protein
LSFVLPLLLSQKIYILVTRREALLNISSFLLAVEDGYDSKNCWYFETQVCRVQGSFKCVYESSSEDGVIWVCHVNHTEGNVFGAWVLESAKGQWECDGSDGFDSFSAEAIEGL